MFDFKILSLDSIIATARNKFASESRIYSRSFSRNSSTETNSSKSNLINWILLE